MDHLWDVSIVPVEDEADSVQEDLQGTGMSSSQPAPADHPDQAGSSSTKPLDPPVADVNIRLSESQDSQNQMPQPAAENTAASSTREAVNNGDDHQSGAPGSTKQAEVPKLKPSFGPKRTASDLEDVKPSCQVTPKKIKSQAKIQKETKAEVPREKKNEDRKKAAAFRALLQANPSLSQQYKELLKFCIWFSELAPSCVKSLSAAVEIASQDCDNSRLAGPANLMEVTNDLFQRLVTEMNDLVRPYLDHMRGNA